MSAYNPPTETLPRFNTTVFIQDDNVTYPVAQGALTIPKQIRIVDGSNTIIITPTSIIINGIVYSLSNIAYLNLSQTFTGVNSFSNSILTNNIDALNTTAIATLFSNLTGRLFIGNSTGNIVIDGLTTTFTNSLLCDTIRGTLTTNAVSLYTTTTGGVTIGNSSGTNVLQGATTITNLLTNLINPIAPTNNIQIGTTQTTGTMNIAPNTSGNITIGGLNSINTYMFGTNVVIGFPSQSITLQGNTQSSGILTAETIRSIVLSNTIRLYDTSTGNIIIGNAGISTNTINGNTTITNTLLANTLTGKAVADNISLYNTSTGTIVIGNAGVSNNTINGLSNYIEGATNTIVGTTNTIYGLSTFENDVTYTGSIICDVIKPKTTGVGGNLVLWDNALGNITIGNNASGITINGLTNFPNGIKIKTIRTASATDIVTLFDTSTSTIILGNAGVSTNTITGISNTITGTTNTINGNTTMSNFLFLTSIRAVTPTAGVFLFDNMTTGSITIGGGSHTSTINIGTSSSSSVAINGVLSVFTTMSANTIRGLAAANAISLFDTSTGTITLGNTASTNTINGITTFNEALSAPTPASQLNTTRVPTTAYLTTYYPSLSSNNSLSGTNTFTSTVLCNTITGTTVGSAISLYATSTGTIALGNTASTNTINGITTFNQALSAPTPASQLNTTRVPTTAYLTTYYAPLTGTIANATAITLTPNTTDTLGYITFSSTASGSSNIKTNTNLTFNASTGKLTTSSLETNTIQGKLVGDAISLYTLTTGGITMGNVSNTNTINGSNTINGITTINNTLKVNEIQGVLASSAINLYTNTTGGINFGNLNQTGSMTLYGVKNGANTNNIFTNTQGSNTNILTSVTSGTLTIGNSTQTGVVSLYGSTTGINTIFDNLTTGSITFGSSSGTNTINGNTTITNTLFGNALRGKAVADNISLYTNTTGTITLGNGTLSTNTITGNTNTITGLSNTITGITNTINGITTIVDTLDVNTVEGKAVTDAISLYATSTSGGITLGNTANTNTINGNTTITNTLIVNTIHSIASGTTTNLYNNLTTGSIIVGSNLTSGAITIGRTAQTGSVTINGALTTGTNNLFNSSTTSAVNINRARTSGVLTIGNSSTTAVTASTNIYGTSVTGTNNLFTNTTTANTNILTNVTTGNIDIGSITQTGYTNIYGASTVGNTSTLYTNVTSGSIDIGTALTTGIMKIGGSSSTALSFQLFGTTSGDNQLFKNVTNGDINFGGTNQTGALYIGGTNQTGGTYISNSGNTTYISGDVVRIMSSTTRYYLDKTTTLTSATTISSPLSKYYICNFTVAGNVNLPTPTVSFVGIEIVIRTIGTAAATPTTVAGTNVFINLSNALTSTLTSTTSFRVVCGEKAGSYYWIQL